MKDVIISAIANYTEDKIKLYVESIDKCGFDGDKIMICYNISTETINYLINHNWIILEGQLNGHPHMNRLIDIYATLKGLDKQYRYVITTDVRDVVFQKNPSEYLEKNLKKEILVSSENVLYKNEPWGVKNILEGYNELFLDRYEEEISCNVGVLAGKYDSMLELLLLNYLVSQAGNTQHYTDQSSFNFIIHNSLVKDKIQIEGLETKWTLQVGTLTNPTLITSYPLEKYDLRDYTIVHQYDRDKDINNDINERYN